MKKNKKIIIIGFGSIGQRHYRNLRNSGFVDVWIFDADKTKTSSKNLKVLLKLNIKNLKQFDVAFICSPSNLHIKQALLAARAGCHLFIEKPLSHNLKGINELSKICRQKKLVNIIACNMRFNPCLKFVKEYLVKKKLGKIYSIHLETGYYLPFWRPKQDYRQSYSAKKSTGGGIIIDGGIHNFDLLFWLNNFSGVRKATLIYNKASNLEIGAEDNFIASFEFLNKVLGLIKGDYLQQPYSWTLKIVGEKGNLEWDFKKSSVFLATDKEIKKMFEIENYNANQMYEEEIKYFLECVENKKTTFNDVAAAGNILKYCFKQ
jgi:predicted dehydrogenase